jgi:ribosome-binding protein aMBF1 (putative translation factor)
MSNDNDDLLNRIKENVMRLRHSKPERVVPAIDDTPERTRASIRKVAQSRISDILRQLRAAHGLSYEEIQQRTGLSQQMLFDIEYKERRLSLAELRKLAECYRVGVNDIVGIDLDAL